MQMQDRQSALSLAFVGPTVFATRPRHDDESQQVADELLSDFLQHARALGGDVQPVKVLRSNTYRIGNSHVLARVAADTEKYFFGLNYINAEEVANLDNSFVAFVCGDVGSSVIMPMSELMKLLPQISYDRNGEFKINITKDFKLALKGRGNRKPLKEFLNNWDLIRFPANAPGEVTSAEHSFTQFCRAG
jgi:hypothetical protein